MDCCNSYDPYQQGLLESLDVICTEPRSYQPQPNRACLTPDPPAYQQQRTTRKSGLLWSLSKLFGCFCISTKSEKRKAPLCTYRRFDSDLDDVPLVVVKKSTIADKPIVDNKDADELEFDHRSDVEDSIYARVWKESLRRDLANATDVVPTVVDKNQAIDVNLSAIDKSDSITYREDVESSRSYFEQTKSLSQFDNLWINPLYDSFDDGDFDKISVIDKHSTHAQQNQVFAMESHEPEKKNVPINNQSNYESIESLHSTRKSSLSSAVVVVDKVDICGNSVQELKLYYESVIAKHEQRILYERRLAIYQRYYVDKEEEDNAYQEKKEKEKSPFYADEMIWVKASNRAVMNNQVLWNVLHNQD